MSGHFGSSGDDRTVPSASLSTNALLFKSRRGIPLLKKPQKRKTLSLNPLTASLRTVLIAQLQGQQQQTGQNSSSLQDNWPAGPRAAVSIAALNKLSDDSSLPKEPGTASPPPAQATHAVRQLRPPVKKGRPLQTASACVQQQVQPKPGVQRLQLHAGSQRQHKPTAQHSASQASSAKAVVPVRPQPPQAQSSQQPTRQPGPSLWLQQLLQQQRGQQQSGEQQKQKQLQPVQSDTATSGPSNVTAGAPATDEQAVLLATRALLALASVYASPATALRLQQQLLQWLKAAALQASAAGRPFNVMTANDALLPQLQTAVVRACSDAQAVRAATTAMNNSSSTASVQAAEAAVSAAAAATQAVEKVINAITHLCAAAKQRAVSTQTCSTDSGASRHTALLRNCTTAAAAAKYSDVDVLSSSSTSTVAVGSSQCSVNSGSSSSSPACSSAVPAAAAAATEASKQALQCLQQLISAIQQVQH